MRKLLLLLILSFFSAQSFAGSVLMAVSQLRVFLRMVLILYSTVAVAAIMINLLHQPILHLQSQPHPAMKVLME